MYWTGMLKLAVMVVTLAGSVVAVAITPTKYMDTYYRIKAPILVNDSLVLELTNSLPEETPEDFVHCAVDVVTDPSRKLIVHFISLDISFESSTPDRVHIYDYSEGQAIRLTPASGLYGIYDGYYRSTSRGVRDYISSESKLRLDYIGKPTRAYKGFQILITSIKDTDSHGKCDGRSIRCDRADVCLPYTVHCDGYSNCGEHDRSDEIDCTVAMTTGWDSSYGTTMAIIVAIVASAIFLAFAAIVAFIVVKYNKRQTRPNIQVTFKRGHASTGDGDLARLYAPPSYDDVFGTTENEPPPAYHTLTSRPVREDTRQKVVYFTQLQGDDDSDDEDCDVFEEGAVAMCSTRNCDNPRKVEKTKSSSSTITISAQISVDCPSDISIINETERRLPAGTVTRVLVPRPMLSSTDSSMQCKIENRSGDRDGQTDNTCSKTDTSVLAAASIPSDDENPDISELKPFLTHSISNSRKINNSDDENVESVTESEAGSMHSAESSTHDSILSDEQNTCYLNENSAVVVPTGTKNPDTSHSRLQQNGDLKNGTDETLDNISDDHDSGTGSSKYIDLHNLSDNSDLPQTRPQSSLFESESDFIDESV